MAEAPHHAFAAQHPGHAFANIFVHPPPSGRGRLPLQRRLAVGSVHDPLESEADTMASAVLSTSAEPGPVQHTAPATVHRKCSCSGQEKCDECSKDKQMLQRQPSNNVTPVEAPSIVHEELRSPGHPLDSAARAFFEPRFHFDLSHIRIHTGPGAVESARAVHAQAYTVGSHIVFNSGMYAPSTASGKHLLAHELTHVLQQKSRTPRTLQRQGKPDEKDKKDAGESSPKSASGSQIKLYTVRDKRLQLGGTLVQDIEQLKKNLMATKDENEWSLVLAVHGSQERLGAQSPPDWQKNAEFYDAAKINSLFEQDKSWVKWRDKYGPTQLSLVACQVSASFEKTLISNLTRVGSKGRQPSRGLGEGCKPIASTVTLNDAPDSLAKFNKLSQSKQDSIRDRLVKLNEKWGYYGLPPVPNDQVTHYYYDEEPKNAWVTVEVMVGKGHSVDELKSTGIPYWDRTTGPESAKFRDLCSSGVGELHGHTPSAPPDPDK